MKTDGSAGAGSSPLRFRSQRIRDDVATRVNECQAILAGAEGRNEAAFMELAAMQRMLRNVIQMLHDGTLTHECPICAGDGCGSCRDLGQLTKRLHRSEMDRVGGQGGEG